jgi:hypothetical protein
MVDVADETPHHVVPNASIVPIVGVEVWNGWCGKDVEPLGGISAQVCHHIVASSIVCTAQ